MKDKKRAAEAAPGFFLIRSLNEALSFEREY